MMKKIIAKGVVPLSLAAALTVGTVASVGGTKSASATGSEKTKTENVKENSNSNLNLDAHLKSFLEKSLSDGEWSETDQEMFNFLVDVILQIQAKQDSQTDSPDVTPTDPVVAEPTTTTDTAVDVKTDVKKDEVDPALAAKLEAKLALKANFDGTQRWGKWDCGGFIRDGRNSYRFGTPVSDPHVVGTDGVTDSKQIHSKAASVKADSQHVKNDADENVRGSRFDGDRRHYKSGEERRGERFESNSSERRSHDGDRRNYKGYKGGHRDGNRHHR